MYRDDDEATRARAEALVERFESAETTLRALALLAGSSRAPQALVALPAGLAGAELAAFVEATERSVGALEHELAQAEAERARSLVKARDGAATTASSSPPPDVLRAAFVRHTALATRLRLLAPLVVAARAGREESHVDPASLLARRPSMRDREAPGASEVLARRLHAMCDAAERELRRLGLAGATGLGADRARDAARMYALLVEIRYERLARRQVGDAYAPEPELSGDETPSELEARTRAYLGRLERIPASARDALDDAIADLVSAWSDYAARAVSSAAPTTPLPTLPDLTDAAAVRAAASAVRQATTALPPKAAPAPLAPPRRLLPEPRETSPTEVLDGLRQAAGVVFAFGMVLLLLVVLAIKLFAAAAEWLGSGLDAAFTYGPLVIGVLALIVWMVRRSRRARVVAAAPHGEAAPEGVRVTTALLEGDGEDDVADEDDVDASGAAAARSAARR